LSANETCTFRFSIDQRLFWTPSGKFRDITSATINSGNGTWYLHAQGRDLAGNLSNVMTASAILDNTAPILSDLSNDSTLRQSKTWQWSTNENCSYRFIIDQNPSWEPSCEFSTIATATKSDGDGKWYLHVQARDMAGNFSDIKTVFANLDNSPPVIQNLSNNLTPTQQKTWTWWASENCTFRYAINQEPSWQPTGDFNNITSATKTSGDGEWYLHIQAIDDAKNLSDVLTVMTILDNTPPVVQNLYDDESLRQNKTWIWSANEPCLFRYAIDQNHTWIPAGEYNAITTAHLSGSYGKWYIHVEAKDLANNVSDVVTKSVQLTMPSIRFNALLSEGNESITQVVLELMLSHTSSEKITVEYQIKNEPTLELAARGKDYKLPEPHIVVIEPGESKGFIELTIMDDDVSENNEICVIELVNPCHYVLLDKHNQYTYTILDNDIAGVSIVNSFEQFEVYESGIYDSFTISLNTAPAEDIYVSVNTDDQITVSPYAILFTSENWNQEQLVYIYAVDDDIYEPQLHSSMISFSIDKTIPQYTDLDFGDIAVNIVDNDSQPIVQFRKSFYQGNESVSPVYLPLFTTRSANQDITVDYTIKYGGTATEDNDYTLNSYQTVIKAFKTEGKIELNVINDHYSETNETFTLEITRSDIALIGANKKTCEYKILNDDYPDMSINGISNSTILTEGDRLSYSITLKTAPESLVTIKIKLDDYNKSDISDDELTFTRDNWNIPQWVTLTTIDDNIYDEDLKVVITHSSHSFGLDYQNVPEKEITVIIKENDPEPTPPSITGKSLTNEEIVIWNIESGGGNGNLSCESGGQIFLCFLGTMRTNFSEGKHTIKVKEEISTGQWTQDAFFEIEKDMGMPCSQVYVPEGIRSENMAFTITYTYEDKYQCQAYINQQCGTGIDHCPSIYDRGSGVNEIELWAQLPDSNEFSLIDSDKDASIDGYFNFTATQEGIYRFYTRAIDKATNSEPKPFHADSSKVAETLYTKEFSGYAILAVGAINRKIGLASHTFSANKIYRHLISRKFGMFHDLKDPLDHIKYFNPHHLELTGVDPFETNQNYPEALKNAITEWARDKIYQLSGPLYIILINHGGTDKFYLTGSNDWLEASELNTWLTQLENDLKQNINNPIPDIILVIDTCYSGSFMNDLIKPESTRIVITSTAENELSFRGPKPPLSELLVRDGAFFASNLFNELSKGVNLSKSFERAAQRTEILSENNTITAKHPFWDNAEQHPLFDDNGINNGHNTLYAFGDGYIATNIKLGFGESSKGPEIIETIIQPNRTISANEDRFDISVRVKNPVDDLKVFIEIRTPDDIFPVTVNEQLQKELDLTQCNLNYVSESLYGNVCDKFPSSGKYTLFFYVQDTDDVVYYSNQSYVYKAKENNNPPEPFQLISPINLDAPENQGSKETECFQVIFNWKNTYDLDRDQFSYTLWISKSSQFDTDDEIKQEDILDTQYYKELPDWDGCDIYWKVQAIDEFGAFFETEVFRFKLDDKNNPEMPIVYFQVYDSQTRLPVPEAKICLETGYPVMTSKRGKLIQKINLSEAIDLTITAVTYETAYTRLYVDDSPIISLSIPLVSNIQVGDINKNEKIDIGDAILGLQILGDMPVFEYSYHQAAVIGDNVGLADIIYVLRFSGR
jgi:hypothetical protein